MSNLYFLFSKTVDPKVYYKINKKEFRVYHWLDVYKQHNALILWESKKLFKTYFFFYSSFFGKYIITIKRKDCENLTKDNIE